jgi:hypothetical protein
MKKQKWHRMLDPQQFKVGEAWIAFRLNSAPIRTERDGDFNCVALMDAASCYILGSELVPVGGSEPSSMYSRRLLKSSQKHEQQLPRTLFVTEGDVADLFTREASRQKIDVVPVPDEDLFVFIGEARQGFAQRFEMDRGEAGNT